MKYFFLIVILFNIMLHNKAHANKTYIVLKVNNNIITNTDINIEYRYLIALNEDLKEIDKKKIIKLAKNSIIREKIKETELESQFDMEESKKFMGKVIENFYKKLGMKNVKEFTTYLSSYNLSLEEVSNKLYIEAAWNDLIYRKFNNKIIINEKDIKEKINKRIANNKKQYKYLLSEILFTIENSENIEKKYLEINKSIKEVGFKSSANLYSISDTGKLGGQIGWVNEGQLSEVIKKQIINLEIGNHTNPIIIPGGLLIINLDNKKIYEKKLNFKKEFKKQVNFEKTNQLNSYSKIYFNKIKKNSTISE